MAKKLIIIISTISISACLSTPFTPPKIINQKTFDLSTPQIIDILEKKLPVLLASTSSKTPKIETKKYVEISPGNTGSALIVTNYKPNDSSLTECTIANNGGWANVWNGLDHGMIGIVLTPHGYGSNATRVQINSSFHENYSVKVPGEVVGYVRGYAVQGTEWVDKASHCYSTGIIERSVFDLIQSKGANTKAPTISNQSKADKLKNSMPEGKTMTLPDDTKLDGELKNGSLEGNGIMTLPDGSKFMGNFINGKLEGPGEMTWPDGTKFIGNFKNGNPEGQVTFVLPGGTRKVGTFKNGEFVQ